MRGFATLDICDRAGLLTVWLTSPMQTIGAGHTARRTERLDRGIDERRLEPALRDRYVVLTERTRVRHPVLARWQIEPVDVDGFADEVRAAQDELVEALQGHGRPLVRPVPGPVPEDGLADADPAQLTLAVADRVQRVWTAWLSREAERVRRRDVLPEHLAAPRLVLLPPGLVSRHVLFGGRPADPDLLAG